jgi:hypothetical protein
MRVLVICDHADSWSAHNRAKALAKFLADVHLTIRPFKVGVLADHEDYDLVHFNFTAGVHVVEPFVRRWAHKCVMSVINERSLFEGYESDPVKLLSMLTACRSVVTLSKRVLERVPHATYIPNGIDEDLFPAPDPAVVGYCGTTKPNKNSHLVREACAQLYLELKSATYGGATGKHTMTHERMHKFYRSLDVYVHPSATEAFNNTVLEALACNVPVIMTRVGAWQEFEGYATFVEPNVESLVAALRPWAGRSLIDQKFLWKNIAPEYRRVYEAAQQRARDGGATAV